MNLSDYDEKTVRVTLKDGDVFEGVCTHNSDEYNLDAIGRAEESLDIDNWNFFRSEIERIALIDGPPAVWMNRRLHCMHLVPAPFEKIERGEKTIEIRLNDEKRRQIRVGDAIRFEEIGGWEDVLYVEVTALHAFDSFAALFAALPPAALG
ncbi:MAG: DUF3850 domain-containing protein, partial [Clostridia bacterium]|nr:DUF3850 domain-containing protein [Clostridia bacterium]